MREHPHPVSLGTKLATRNCGLQVNHIKLKDMGQKGRIEPGGPLSSRYQ